MAPDIVQIDKPAYSIRLRALPHGALFMTEEAYKNRGNQYCIGMVVCGTEAGQTQVVWLQSATTEQLPDDTPVYEYKVVSPLIVTQEVPS